MAVQHISINRSAPHGDALYQGLVGLEAALTRLKDEVGAMPFMVDMTPDPDDYSYLEAQFGFPTGKGATAKAELESMLGKLTTDASVSNVASSMQQVFNFFA